MPMAAYDEVDIDRLAVTSSDCVGAAPKRHTKEWEGEKKSDSSMEGRNRLSLRNGNVYADALFISIVEFSHHFKHSDNIGWMLER